MAQVLLKKIQEQPNVLWNKLLSWLFIQQRDYKKAFAQEKAIFKREQETLQGVIDLAIIAKEEDEVEVANEIYLYVIDNTFSVETILDAHKNLLELEIKHASKKDLRSIQDKYLRLFDEFGRQAETVDLQLSYGHFLAFHLAEPVSASDFLKETLENNLSRFQEAKIKLKLGDILVFQEKFNVYKDCMVIL